MTAAAFLKKRDSWLRKVVEDETLAHATVRVGVHIAMRMNGSKQSGAWPSVETIAASCNVGERSVLRAIDELCGLNRATGEWTGTRYLTAERKRNAGNRYWLNFFWE
jgi:hypothetical protein